MLCTSVLSYELNTHAVITHAIFYTHMHAHTCPHNHIHRSPTHSLSETAATTTNSSEQQDNNTLCPVPLTPALDGLCRYEAGGVSAVRKAVPLAVRQTVAHEAGRRKIQLREEVRGGGRSTVWGMGGQQCGEWEVNSVGSVESVRTEKRGWGGVIEV